MHGYAKINTSYRRSVAGTFGELQVTAAREQVVVDIQSRDYDTAGYLHYGHALAKLPLETAQHLRDLLNAAIAAAATTTRSPDSGSDSASRILLGYHGHRGRAV